MAGFLLPEKKYAPYLWGFIFGCFISVSFVQAAESTNSQVNAFFLQSIPARYHDLEILFQRLKPCGANTVIARLPVKNGAIDAASLTNLTFLSHQAGLRIYVVLPTRLDNHALEKHPEWEDFRYDLRSGNLQPTGSMDLANPQVVAHLVKRFKEVAAFSIDGILLDEDFRYDRMEGMSAAIRSAYLRKYGTTLSAKKVFENVSAETAETSGVSFGASFWQWSELKRDAVVNAARELGKACRAVQRTIKFGIPLHVPGGETPQLALARFAYDMNAFRKLDIDFYWFELRSNGKGQGGRSYKKDFEQFSRRVKASSAMEQNPAKIIVVVPATVSGRVLPLFEIEDTTALARQTGKTTGIAYLIEHTAIPPAALTRKLFRSE